MDLNGDVAIGIEDLILLLASWDDPYDAEHLIAMIHNWGSCR